jgi:hypothetical protein
MLMLESTPTGSKTFGHYSNVLETYFSVESFHLFRYLDEQSFHFNFCEGNDQERFIESLTLTGDRQITYKQLTKKVEG